MELDINLEARRKEPLWCPTCGSELSVKLLVVEDEAGQEALLLIDCPRNDFRATATEKDVVRVVTERVMERLRRR